MPKEDGGAVDSNLVVYGTKNVRVVGAFFLRCALLYQLALKLINLCVDASIIPIQISAHPSATVYGVAEKVCLIYAPLACYLLRVYGIIWLWLLRRLRILSKLQLDRIRWSFAQRFFSFAIIIWW